MQSVQSPAGASPGKMTSINWSLICLLFFVVLLASMIASGLLLWLTKKLILNQAKPSVPPAKPAPRQRKRYTYVPAPLPEPNDEEEEDEDPEDEEDEEDPA